MNSPFPPEGYESTPSNVPGIHIYKPKADEDGHQEVVAFSCPNCGASSAFCADNGALTCTHCKYYEEAEDPIFSGKGSEELEFTLETVQRASQGWGLDRKELVCENCGGHTVVAPENLSHTCPFCHSHKVIQQQAPQDALRPRFLIPIKVHTDLVKSNIEAWMGRHWLLPSDLHRLAHATDFVPMYIPYWTFDARGKARWKAEVGKWESRGEKSELVWRWESGWAETYFDDLLVSGSSHLEEKLLEKIQRFDLRELTPYNPSFLAGVHAQAYEVSLDEAWMSARSIMRESLRGDCLEKPSGSEIRNFHMGLQFSEESWRYILLPFLVGSYEYNGKSYQVLINGQNKRMAGRRPVDWRKLGKISLLSMLPGLLLLLGILAFPQFQEELTIGGIGALVLSAIVFLFLLTSAFKLQRL